jgi:hypothetical protein
MSSTNFRAFRVEAITGSIAMGPTSKYSRVWGVMKGEFGVSGSLSLEGGGSINLGSLDNHQIFPCYPSAISCSAGTILILS